LNRTVSTATSLAATALLVGLVAMACSGRGNGAANQVGTTPPIPVVTTAPVASPTLTVAPTDTAVPSESPAGIDAPATPDPLDSDLSGIQNLLNGVNSQLSGNDPGSAGGE
jgi:hypothetical protein